MTYSEIIKKLKSLYNRRNIDGMARFGINSHGTLGIPMPTLRRIAKRIGHDHKLALRLWDSKIHDARLLASMVDKPEWVTNGQMDKWVKDFDSWDICDSTCLNLFRYTPAAFLKCYLWIKSEKEFVRRAGFALMAALAFSKQKFNDKAYIEFLPKIIKYSTDERNYVRKAVNWALRQIGKRNLNLNKEAIKIASKIAKINDKAARWIAADALRELKSPAVLKRLKNKKHHAK